MMPNCTWSLAALALRTPGAPCTAGIAAATAVTAPAALTKSRRETSWSWDITRTSSPVFPDCSMHVLVTELLVARIVQWMLRPAAVALWLGTLIVPLHAQPAPPPPAPAQIKPVQVRDLQIPKLTTPPRIEQFLGGASRADLRRIDDFRQRQPGDGVPVSRKTSAWIGYDDRNFYAVFRSAVPRRRLAGRPAPHRRFPPAPARRRRARQPQNFRLDRLRRSELLRGLQIGSSSAAPRGPTCAASTISASASPATACPSAAKLPPGSATTIGTSTRSSDRQFLGGASRADLRRIDDFRQRQPGDGVPVSRKTSAWIGYDDRNFYAVFVCDAPPGQTRARLSKREDIMSDDLVGVFFDTYHSGQRGYEFFVNALGVQADAALAEGQNDDISFNHRWYSAKRLTPEGYVAMLTIPFRSLRFPSQAVQTWGFGLRSEE